MYNTSTTMMLTDSELLADYEAALSRLVNREIKEDDFNKVKWCGEELARRGIL